MKNIILIDRDLTFLEEVLSRNYTIVVLIVDADAIRDDLKARYADNEKILNIFSMQDVGYTSGGFKYLDYDFMNSCIKIQRDQEFIANRYRNNGALSLNYYYNSLGFWRNIFSSHEIDFVLADCINLGTLINMPSYVSKIFKKKSFFMYPSFRIGSAIFDMIDNQFVMPTRKTIDANVVPTQKTIMSSNGCVFYSFDVNKLTHKTISRSKNRFKYFILKTLHKIGGQILVDFVFCLSRFDFNLKLHEAYFPYSFFEKFKSFLYLKKMKRYYDRISTKQVDMDCNFVFYAMHFEPEAGTAVVVDLQNQLTIIQMLSEAMPKGWKLYIKEHPHQFNLNNPLQSYFFYNIKWWKNIEFYKELQKLKNVEILDFNIHSKTLINRAKAIATINGTIVLESILLNKPVVVFGGNCFPMKTKNMITVSSYLELKDAFDNLQANPMAYDLEDAGEKLLTKFSDFSILNKTENFASIVIDSIEKYLNQTKG